MTVIQQKNFKIGIALGSGSARGWSHIGVLNALKDIGIEPDIVAGCSIGALVGAAYAMDELPLLEQWSKTLTLKQMIGFLDISFSKGGIVQGDKLFNYFKEQLGDPEIESLPKVFATVATELPTGREIWLKKGSMLNAVRASLALPGLLSAAKVNDKWLIDGGLVNPVPVSLCRALGADIVIAVNLNGDLLKNAFNVQREDTSNQDTSLEIKGDDETNLLNKISLPFKAEIRKQKSLLTAKFSQLINDNGPSTFDVLATSINIMQDRITRSRMAGETPEIMISPRLSQLGLMEFDKASIAIEEGRKSVERVRSELQYILIPVVH